MSATELIPTNIERREENLAVQWSDGHESLYRLRDLRLACQCANCIDEWTRRPLLKPETVAADIHPLSADYVGRYGISFAWSDGHASGIYTFDFLRSLCPCTLCRQGR